MKNLVLNQGTFVIPRCRHGLRRFSQSDCAAATPEYAVLTFAVVAILFLSVAQVGYRASDVFRAFGHNTDDRQVRSLDGSAASTSSDLTQTTEHILTMSLELVAILIIGAWLLSRYKSRNASNKPRPLEAVTRENHSDRVFEKRQQILRIMSNNRDTFLQGKLEVRHLATSDPITIARDQSIETACAMMEEQNVDHLLVCAADHTLLGLVSKHYLQRTQLRKVADAMETQPLFVVPNAMLNPTVTHMLNEGVSCVAVAEDGKAVGTLTTTDIQLALQAALQILAKTASDERSDDLVSVLETECAMELSG